MNRRGRGRPPVVTARGEHNRTVWANMLADVVLELTASMERAGHRISRREAERRVAVGLLSKGAGYFADPVEGEEEPGVAPDPLLVKKTAKAIQNELLWLRRERGGALRSSLADPWQPGNHWQAPGILCELAKVLKARRGKPRRR